MKCPACGANILVGSSFCPKCGQKLEEQKPIFNMAQVKEFSGKAIQMGGDIARKTGTVLSQKASDLKDAAVDVKEDIENKLTELDRMLESTVTEYNDAYTLMNDKGMQLYIERCRATDLIENVECLINSIANRPKSFDADFEEINMQRQAFVGANEYAQRELQAARAAVGGAGAGVAAGAAVAFMAPTAAMWIATTFGTASTGAAISTLSGVAATNAALAWLGGGALASGGAGVAGGQALLALAGPIGWTVAGATLLTSIILFTKNRAKLNKEKNEEIEVVKRNTERIKEMDAQINSILTDTSKIRGSLNDNYHDCLSMFNCDYTALKNEQKQKLGSMVNLTKALSALYDKKVVPDEAEPSEESCE